MYLPVFHVDAFTAKAFAGNPAAVIPLGAWLDDQLMQAVAGENNLSETAFFVPRGDFYDLRWFTPRCEVKLCGHATLASAFVLLRFLDPGQDTVQFETRFSGRLTVSRDGDRLAMDFPARLPWRCAEPPAELIAGLGKVPAEVWQIKEDKYFAVFEHEEDVRGIRPDLRVVAQLHPAAVAVTAPGNNADFVSRYFAPSYGVPEDPVTGSSHCALAPYWAERLGKPSLHARQLSERGGELWCEVQKERVILKGNAVLTLRGELQI